MQPGGSRSGIDVFTWGTDMRSTYGLNLGDSVVVEFARVANFTGDVELLSPNGSAGSPNLVLRKVSSGNPLPPYLHGSAIQFVQFSRDTFLTQNLTELVTLDGPIHVARTAGLVNSMIVVSNAAPADSVFIDCNKLATITLPPLGTVLSDISGISNYTSRGFRIMVRDANDLVPAPLAVDLTDGPSGQDDFAQSFEETRGVDVTVLGTRALSVTSMTLRGLNLGVAQSTVGARIYDSGTHALVATANAVVAGGTGLSVTVPIAASLVGGASYRLCFFVDAGGSGGSVTVFDPNPPSVGDFPYTESTSSFQVTQAYDSPGDGFPTGPNTLVPLITVQIGALVGVPPSSPGDGRWALGPVRPDPLTAQGAVEFTVAKRSRVEVERFTAAGKRLGLSTSVMEPGPHSVPLGGQGMKPGVYFVRLSAYSDDGALSFRSARKFVVVAR
jgi:hypothetical protein